jgi:hypothetical protein
MGCCCLVAYAIDIRIAISIAAFGRQTDKTELGHAIATTALRVGARGRDA